MTPSSPVSLRTRLYDSMVKSCKRAMHKWDQLQVSHRSSYSVERLLAYDNYYQRTSVLRAVVVCLLSPLPALATAVLIECIPLEDPALGWTKNPNFWVRFTLTVMLCIQSITVQAQRLIPDLPIKNAYMICVSCIASMIYMGFNVGLAYVWRFPIPFTLVVGGSPSLMVWTALVVALIGKQTLLNDPKLKFYLVRFLWFIGFEASLMIIYPVYNAVFLALDHKLQLPFFCLLPVLKLGLKNTIAHFAGHLEDYLPELTVFSVECFNSIYMVVCMQSTSSTTTAATILGLDLLFSAFSLRSLHHRCRAVFELHHKGTQGVSQHDWLTAVLAMTEKPQEFKPEDLGRIRLRACLQHQVTSKNKEILDALASHRGNVRQSTRKQSKVVAATTRKFSRAVKPMAFVDPNFLVAPGLSSPKGPKSMEITSIASTREHHVKLVRPTLRLLFHSEYLALVEYVESIIPLLYVLYISALVHLPNNKFYPRTRDMTPERLTMLIVNIGSYGLLEMATFIAFTAIMMRHFGLSPLYQVAFVLETQTALVQGKLIVWLLFALQFPLVHFGTFKSLARVDTRRSVELTTARHVCETYCTYLRIHLRLGADFSFKFQYESEPT